jgi:hypothetical protein
VLMYLSSVVLRALPSDTGKVDTQVIDSVMDYNREAMVLPDPTR